MTSPRPIESLADLSSASGERTEVCGLTGAETVTTQGWRYTAGKLRVKTLRGGTWTTRECTFDAGLVVANAKWEELSFYDCAVGQGQSLTIEDCQVERLDIRGFRGTLALLRCDVGQFIVHGAESVSIRSSNSSSLKFSEIGKLVSLSDVSADTLQMVDCDGPDEFVVQVWRSRIRGHAVLARCTHAKVNWSNSSAGSLNLDKCSMDASFKEIEVLGQVSWRAVDSPALRPTRVEGLVTGDILIDSSGRQNPLSVEFINFTARRDLHLRGNVIATFTSGSLDGQLQVPCHSLGDSRVQDLARRTSAADREASRRGPVGDPPPYPVPRVALGPEFRIDQVLVPEIRIGGRGTARRVATELLGAADVNCLSTLRRGLADRPHDQDQVYFAERCEMMANQPRWLLRGWAKRWVFGFGVRFLEPASALCCGILLTWLAIVIAGALGAVSFQGSQSGIGDWPQYGVLAAQMWFNVGAALPEGVTGTLWAAASVCCAAAGLILTTTLIGIGIRRLVR